MQPNEISPDWTPEERLKVIAAIADNLSFTARTEGASNNAAINTADIIGAISTRPAHDLEKMRSHIFFTFLGAHTKRTNSAG